MLPPLWGRPDQADALLSSELIFPLPVYFAPRHPTACLLKIHRKPGIAVAPPGRVFYLAKRGGREPAKRRSAQQPQRPPGRFDPGRPFDSGAREGGALQETQEPMAISALSRG